MPKWMFRMLLEGPLWVSTSVFFISGMNQRNASLVTWCSADPVLRKTLWWTNIAIENGPVEIVVIFPLIAWWIFPVSYVNVHQRVSHLTWSSLCGCWWSIWIKSKNAASRHKNLSVWLQFIQKCPRNIPISPYFLAKSYSYYSSCQLSLVCHHH